MSPNLAVISSTPPLRSPPGARKSTGAFPVVFVISRWVSPIFLLISAYVSSVRYLPSHEWLPISWPALAMPWVSFGCFFTSEPMRKNVAFALYLARVFSSVWLY